MKSKNLVNFYLLFLSIFTFLIVAEIVVRLNPKLYSKGMRPSKNEKIVYELIPGCKIEPFEERVSSQGLRDRFFSEEKPADAYRIAIVGDSITYGISVPRYNTFPKILERKLNQGQGRKFEVINFSVPGYNTAQECELISSRVLKFNPDMLILVSIPNDFHLCDLIKREETFLNYLDIHSFFIHLILRRIDIFISHKTGNPYAINRWLVFKRRILRLFYPFIIYPHPALEEIIYVNGSGPHTFDMVPKIYWYMLGMDSYKFHLSKINNLLKERRVKFVSIGYLVPEVSQIHQELGIENFHDFSEVIESKDEFVIDKVYNHHLNEKGHYVFADFVYNLLKEINYF